MRSLFLKGGILLLILSAFFFEEGSAQTPTKVGTREDGKKGLVIELREVPKNEPMKEGQVPDSLAGDYFVDEEGVVYKLFDHVEPFIAHFKGYHPRPFATAERHIIYIKSFEDSEKFDLELSGSDGKTNYLIRYEPGEGELERID